MTYFAIGESDGGAGERRLGPFETVRGAQDAGVKETKESNGAFVFKGVVNEANNQVFGVKGTVGGVTTMDERLEVSNSVHTTCPVVANAIAANRRAARNADEDFDEPYVRMHLDSIYNDLDDLEDYINRFQSKSPKAAKFKSMVSTAKRSIR